METKSPEFIQKVEASILASKNRRDELTYCAYSIYSWEKHSEQKITPEELIEFIHKNADSFEMFCWFDKKFDHEEFIAYPESYEITRFDFILDDKSAYHAYISEKS